MLTIRLARTGRKKLAMYRIVVADSKRATTGRYVNLLGHYNPHTKELSIKKEDMERYLSNGAQPSNAVAKLLVKEGVKLPEWVTITTRTRAPKKAAPAEPEAKPPAAAEDAAEPVVDESAEPVAEVAAAETAAKEEVASAPTAEVETKSSGPEDPKTETAESGEAAEAAAEEASRTAADVAKTAAEEKSDAA